MSNADTSEAARSEAARVATRARWGSQVVTQAAAIVVERVDELPPTVRAKVHLATADQEVPDGI
jgi:hypothetical protein